MKSKKKITISVDLDFYPILLALPGVVGKSRDELVINAVKEKYREEIQRIADLAETAQMDEEEGSTVASTALPVATP